MNMENVGYIFIAEYRTMLISHYSLLSKATERMEKTF